MLRLSFSRASRANFPASPLVRPAGQNRHATQAIRIATTGFNGVAKCRLFFQAILVQTSAENYVIKWTVTALKITNDSRETFVLSYKFFVFVRYISFLETVPSVFVDAP